LTVLLLLLLLIFYLLSIDMIVLNQYTIGISLVFFFIIGMYLFNMKINLYLKLCLNNTTSVIIPHKSLRVSYH